jgi:hypothetical protein
MDYSSPEATAQSPSPQPQKFMRYRSVRKAVADPPSQRSPPPLPQAVPETVATNPTNLTRLPSRYHRRPPAPSGPPLPIPRAIAQQDNAPQQPLQAKTALRHAVLPNHHETHTYHESAPQPSGATQHHNGGSGSRPSTRQTGKTASTPRKHTFTSEESIPEPAELRRSFEAAREEARLLLEGEQDRLKALRLKEAKRRQEERAKRRQEERELRQKEDEEAKRLEEQVEAALAAKRQRETERAAKKAAREEQKSPRLRTKPGREEQGPDASVEADSPPQGNSSRMRTLIVGGLGSPRQGSQVQGHHRRASSAIEHFRQKTQRGHGKTNSASHIDEMPEVNIPLPTSNFDAPVSAVNAGERRVNVKCQDSTITLPVTPTTTAKDILSSASLCMSASIDPHTAVLLESFMQLGLERPLRRYERVRDVMNSWDNDNQHHLSIMSGSECEAPGLQITDAPHQQPLGTTVHVYHSQRPGKWDKRWIKLREDGQITISKNETGIDSTNICHLSDFDLYTPTARQIRKLRPPKKICYALKSQEKSAMFLDGANFAHFFCTKEKDVADKWYRAVHSWRSWYLVNMLGEGQRDPPESAAGLRTSYRPGTSNSGETMPYVLGSFKPLFDFGALDGQKPLIDLVPSRPSVDEQSSPPRVSARSHGAAPPTAFPRKFQFEPAANATGDEDGPFTGTGLLARSASRRTQGGSRTGRGVPGVEGRPLVDLTPMSEFTDGSLLRRMENIAAQQGSLEPKIDRQKRREVDVAVGEGF